MAFIYYIAEGEERLLYKRKIFGIINFLQHSI